MMVTVTETCSKLYIIEYIVVFVTERLFGYKQIFLSLSPTALQSGVGLGLLQEFPPTIPV